MPTEFASSARPPIAARLAVAATIFAAVLAFGLLVPDDTSPGVIVTAALIAGVCEMGYVSWYERLPTRTERQPLWRVLAFAVAASGGFLLYVALMDGDVDGGAVVVAAGFALIALAIGLADGWIWLRRHSS